MDQRSSFKRNKVNAHCVTIEIFLSLVDGKDMQTRYYFRELFDRLHLFLSFMSFIYIPFLKGYFDTINNTA